MSETYFRFRQFTVHQERAAMKVGTDAVLLGSWIEKDEPDSILDIGTGTGVLALMLAQRYQAGIEAVEIDFESSVQARKNADLSPWGNRISIYHQSLQEFCPASSKNYDLIVSNPPYFDELTLAGDPKTQAKHRNTLTLEDLLACVKKLLSPKGSFFLILPPQEGRKFYTQAYASGLFCRKLLKIITKSGKPEKRWLMEFRSDHGACEEKELVMLDEMNFPTEDYASLTSQYYPTEKK